VNQEPYSDLTNRPTFSKEMTMQGDDVRVEESVVVETEMTQPIIVDLGKQKTSKIKDLKEGEGELWDEVLDVIEEVQEMLAEEADGKVMVPLILIYEKKRRRRRLENLLFPLAAYDDDEEDDDEEDD
jgi:hypothetical protein